ncbi:MAG: hypothetical protein JNK49_04130 [Planctomycetes bacterium]|nr:hypothetical protein [Planctomycetota bacterium]
MRCVASSLAVVLIAAPIPTQTPAAWATLSATSTIDPNAVVSIGKLTTYRTGNALYVHSAATRRWHSTALGANPTIRVTNDCVLVQDNGTWTGFASHRGTFEALAVTATAQLLNAGNNDSLLLVRDGGTLHAFSGFTGTWVSRPIGANFAWAAQRHVAVIHDGTVLSGMDAFTGTWHDLPGTTTPSQLSADGTAGLAISSTEIAGFSANTASWQTHTPLPGATMTRRGDWALLYDANQAVAYSGTRGAFADLADSITAVPHGEDCFCLFETAQGLAAYSAIRNSFAAPFAPLGSRVHSDVAVATVVDGPFVHGYSAPRGTVATTVMLASAEEVAGSVAFALDQISNLPKCFSALTGQWYDPPTGTTPGTPTLTTTMALLATTGGITAFSARSGRFVPLQGTGLVRFGSSASAVGGAYDSNQFHAFDGRTDRWLATPRTSGASPVLAIWRTAMYAIDGNTVHGFGSQGSTWASTPLPEPLMAHRVNSESSRIVTDHFLLAHSALAELVSTAQFPDFRRVTPVGSTTWFHLDLAPNDLALFAGGLFAVPQAVPGFGSFWLAPSSVVSQLVLPTIGGGTRIPLTVPAVPSLVGTEWGFQALVAPSQGQAHLTGPASLLLL